MVAIIAAIAPLISTAKSVLPSHREICQFVRDLPKLFSVGVVSIATTREPKAVVGNLPTSHLDPSVLRLQKMSVPIPNASLPLIVSSVHSPQELRPEEY